MPLEPDYDKATVLRILRELMKREGFDKGKLEKLLKKVEAAKSDEEVKEALKSESEIYPEVRARLIEGGMLEEIADKTHGFVGADLAASPGRRPWWFSGGSSTRAR